MNELEEQIKAVAEARQKATGLRSQRFESVSEWNKANKELLDAVSQAEEDVAAKEAQLRELTLQVFAFTDNKTPAEGVSVKVFSKLEYDPKEALKWSMSHQVALKLDAPIFENLAKAAPMDFVQTKDEPRAQIAQDLSAALKEEG